MKASEQKKVMTINDADFILPGDLVPVNAEVFSGISAEMDEFKVEKGIVKCREHKENQGSERTADENLTPQKKTGTKARKTNARKPKKNQGTEAKKENK